MRGALVVLCVACAQPMPPGDEDAGVEPDACELDGGACPSGARTVCRLERLVAAAQACSTSDDCTVYQVGPNCLDYGRCGLAVGFRDEASVSSAIDRELGSFCRAPVCRPVAPSCRPRSSAEVSCVGGRCVFVVVDAGAPDAGTRDGGR